MVFLFIFLIIILMFLTSKLKIEFINVEYKSNVKEKVNKDFKIKIVIHVFQKIPILKVKIDNNKVLNNKRLVKIIKEQKGKFIINKKDINEEVIEAIKNFKMELKQMDLKILLGTENAAITAIIIPLISTFLALFLSKKISKINDKQIFSIMPVYNNENVINIQFSGIFEIKMIHIINTICITSKKRGKGDKNERASNRRAYDYSYE